MNEPNGTGMPFPGEEHMWRKTWLAASVAAFSPPTQPALESRVQDIRGERQSPLPGFSFYPGVSRVTTAAVCPGVNVTECSACRPSAVVISTA